MKLKPCPFCGGEARVTGSFEVYGECRECGAEGEHFYARPIYGDSEEAAKKKATEAWNRRTVGWISVKERLPEENTKAIVITEDKQMLVASYTSFGWMYPCYGEEPTHWMQLPPPPEGGQDD